MRAWKCWCRAALAGLLLAGAAAHAYEITDDAGSTTHFERPPMRIVSLLPSLTETVCALKACDRLVGVDRYSNWPDAVHALPQVGGGLDPSIEAVVALKPDVVLLASSSRASVRLRELGLKVLALEPKTRAAMRRTTRQLGELLQVDGADSLLQAIDAGVNMFMKKPIFVNSLNQAFANLDLKKPREIKPDPVFDFTGKRVLLAEDNSINAEIAKRLLENKNCTVEVVPNGAEAVESFAEKPQGYFDAILMDVRMPIMDGLSATKAIRAMRKEGSKTVPILAMTANAFAEDVNLSLQSGMNAHLTKPIEPLTFFATLQKFIKK